MQRLLGSLHCHTRASRCVDLFWQTRSAATSLSIRCKHQQRADSHYGLCGTVDRGTVQQFSSSRRARRGVPYAAPAWLSVDTDIETAVESAVLAAGRTPSALEKELAQRLKQNWYTTAGQVAAMSQDELELLKVPVKLWAVLKEQLETISSTTTEAQTATADSTQTTAYLQHKNDTKEQSHTLTDAISTTSTAATVHDGLPADIMQRRMPVRLSAASTSGSDSPELVRRIPLRSTESYGLKEGEMSDSLCAELAALEKFTTTRFYGQLVEPLALVTYKTVTLFYVKLLMGYIHRVQGVPLDQLSLSTLLPSSGREGVTLLLQYNSWRQQERGTTAGSSENAIKAMIHLARFLFHDQAQASPDPKVRPYDSIDVMKELKALQRTAAKASSTAGRVSDDSKKWLEWDDYLAMVRALRAECAGLTSAGIPRPRKSVAESLQRYLLVAILSVVPDRQRTLRELEVGRTLIKRTDGTWVIKHGPGDYKTGKQYGDRPPMPIAPFVYPELEAFIDTWRQELNPKTNRLFCRPQTGEPMTANCVYSTFKSAAVRLTGKATHPHLIRDMVVTHLRLQKTGEEKMESLALFMGHSVNIQRASYDRRTKAERVKPAEELMLGLWGGTCS